MLDGAAGLPGVPAQEDKCQEADLAPIRPPTDEAVAASDRLQSKSNVRTQKCSIYSKSQTTAKNVTFLSHTYLN